MKLNLKAGTSPFAYGRKGEVELKLKAGTSPFAYGIAMTKKSHPDHGADVAVVVVSRTAHGSHPVTAGGGPNPLP